MGQREAEVVAGSGKAGVDDVVHAMLLGSGNNSVMACGDDVVLAVPGRDEDQGLNASGIEARFVIEVHGLAEITEACGIASACERGQPLVDESGVDR